MPPMTRRGRRDLLTPSQARRLFDYNRRLFERYARFVRRLPGRAARRKREIGHQSLFDTLVHILNVHEVWIAYVLAHRDSDEELRTLFRDRSRHPSDWRGFQRYQRRVWGAVEAYLDRLTPAKLSDPVHAFWMRGEYVASDGLLQSTFEQAHHLGEIIGALWQEDREPPAMTWIEIGRGYAAGRRRFGRRPHRVSSK